MRKAVRISVISLRFVFCAHLISLFIGVTYVLMQLAMRDGVWSQFALMSFLMLFPFQASLAYGIWQSADLRQIYDVDLHGISRSIRHNLVVFLHSLRISMFLLLVDLQVIAAMEIGFNTSTVFMILLLGLLQLAMFGIGRSSRYKLTYVGGSAAAAAAGGAMSAAVGSSSCGGGGC